MSLDQIFSYLLPVLVAPIFILAGTMLYLFPPKSANWFYGYRTTRSMKNQTNWDYAQKMGAKLMIQFSLINFVVLSIIGFVMEKYLSLFELVIPIQSVTLILLCFLMLWVGEKRLKSFEDSN